MRKDILTTVAVAVAAIAITAAFAPRGNDCPAPSPRSVEALFAPCLAESELAQVSTGSAYAMLPGGAK